ncbi:MAG: hypothetical protein IJM44_02345 [Ruminococcus sp.]|nr:hypothetical protein [Ruminococcus sp.]
MRCPHCRGRVSGEDEFCPHCKKRLKLELTPELRSVNKRLILTAVLTMCLMIFGSGLMFSGVSPGDSANTDAGRRVLELTAAARVTAGLAAAVNIVLAREELTDKKDMLVGRAAGWVLLTLIGVVIFDIACTSPEDGIMPFTKFPLVYVSLALHIALLALLLRLRERTRRAMGKETGEEEQKTSESGE